MFFKKEKKLKESPLNYWEENSYMLVFPEDETKDLLTGIFERVGKIEGVEIKETKTLKIDEPGYIKLIYDNEEYEVGFYPNNFQVPESYMNNKYYFKAEEIEKLKKVTRALTIFMKFKDDSKKSFHLQLKLAVAMVPDMIGLMDESAEKILPASWVRLAAKSNVTPGPADLYTVQAIYDKNGEVWLHTHGLCRCGLTELEILKSDKENYNNHYNLISTFASYLIDKNKEFNVHEDSAYIGMLINNQPVVVTCVPWTEGLKEYKKLTLGDVKDRKEGHNTKTSLIFIYKSEEDEKQKRISKVSEYNNLWGENPLFFISNEETARMKQLAMERFNYVKEEFGKEENKIIIKIGLPIDDNKQDFEHIWFELIEFEGDKFKAKLLQDPYNVENIHEGDERWYTVDDVTDWVIYTPGASITPDRVNFLTK